MDLSILAAPDAKPLLESPLGDSGWNLNKLLHRTATDPVAASRLGCAVFALAVAYVQAHLENTRLGTELADTRRTMNQAISETETIRGSVAGMESGAIEADRDRALQRAQTLETELATMRTRVEELTRANEHLRLKVAERDGEKGRLMTEVDRLSRQYQQACRQLDSVRTELGHRSGEVVALQKAGAAMETELSEAREVIQRQTRELIERSKVKHIEPIAPWGLGVRDDEDEQGKPIPPWPDALPAEVMERFAEEVKPEPQLRFKTEVYKVEYAHEATGWVSDIEFRTKLRTMGEDGWKVVSHHMDLSELAGDCHYVVFGKRIVS